ncbi:hypothetical protein BCR32DRAFT_277923, partial [Anaeromyces robustus]
MKIINYIPYPYLFLGIIILLINKSYTKTINTSSSNDSKKNIQNKESSVDDNYYMIFVNDTCFSTLNIKKREEDKENNFEINDDIFLMVNEIHDLIIENKDTYKNVTKFEEIDNQNELKFGKRDVDIKYATDYGDSNYIYPIGSIYDNTILYAYLSTKLIKSIEKMPCVTDIIKDKVLKKTSYYNEIDIQQQAQWDGLEIQNNAPNHLSVISQGKYRGDLINKYDTNYYYPESAGKNVDIFILDGGFNFNYEEYKSNGRTTKCDIAVINGRIINKTTSDVPNLCNLDPEKVHGILVSAVAGGSKNGVAKKANIHGINLNNITYSNVFTALIYIKNHLKKESSLINDMSEEGSIFVASAGNHGRNVHETEELEKFHLPCILDNVICVGGIDNNVYESTSGMYRLHEKSNYGKE